MAKRYGPPVGFRFLPEDAKRIAAVRKKVKDFSEKARKAVMKVVEREERLLQKGKK